jgi:hypothetical protein
LPLLDALTELAGMHTVLEEHQESLDVADRAVALAAELGVEPPARVIGFRGSSRFFVGDAGGLDDLDEAYERLVASGASRFATVVRFNRARARWHVEGPRSLDEFVGARDFALGRGQELSARFALGAIAFTLTDQGRYQDTVELVRQHLPEADAIGDRYTAQTLRTWLATVPALQGDTASAEHELGIVLADASGERRNHAVLIAALIAQLREERARARELLDELLDYPPVAKHPPSIGNLPLIARTAVAIGDARRIEELVDSVYPGFGFTYLDTVATAARAVLAEADGDHARAAELAGSVLDPLEAARAYPERAHALLVLGRSRLALGDRSGLDDVRGARDVFADLGLRPALAEADAVLGGAVAREA